MIRLLVDPRQSLEDCTPNSPERVPVQPGDVVVQKRDGAYWVFRHEPGAAEIGVLVFESLHAAIDTAREAERYTPHLPQPSARLRAPPAPLQSARVIELARYRGRSNQS